MRMRVAVLCNNRMAIPALQELAAQKVLAAVGIPETNADLLQELGYFLHGTEVPIRSLTKASREQETAAWLKTLGTDYVFLMTFPWKIPAGFVDAFSGRVYNFHYGLLPETRGNDPVFESIRGQLSETGITVHAVTDTIDGGPVLAVHKIPLSEGMTHGWLCTQLGMLGGQLCRALLPFLAANPNPPLQAQPEGEGRYFPRPGIKDVVIDWAGMDSSRIHALVRACNPWNKGAYTHCRGWNFRLVSVSLPDEPALPADTLPGTIIGLDGIQGAIIYCKDNKALKLEVFYCDEGFFEGKALPRFGLQKGDRLTAPM